MCSDEPWPWRHHPGALLIVLMGGVVMLIVLAVLMPIMELNQWVKVMFVHVSQLQGARYASQLRRSVGGGHFFSGLV
jgi:hypothetical protein